ncbi:MAG TPA: hypothetical protein VGK77_27490 [Candidatus Binatia bacterium]|jgi:hypothetical protein
MTTDNPSYVRRDNFRRRLEPFGDSILHGAGQDPKAFKLYFDAIGESKPALYMTYIGLDKVRRYFTVFAPKFCEWLQKALERDLSLPRL